MPGISLSMPVSCKTKSKPATLTTVMTDVVVWIKCIVNNLILHITVVSLELKVLWCEEYTYYLFKKGRDYTKN